MPRKMFKVRDKVQIQYRLFVLALKLRVHNRICVQNSFAKWKASDVRKLYACKQPMFLR